jgi:hypothetical protein
MSSSKAFPPLRARWRNTTFIGHRNADYTQLSVRCGAKPPLRIKPHVGKRKTSVAIESEHLVAWDAAVPTYLNSVEGQSTVREHEVGLVVGTVGVSERFAVN